MARRDPFQDVENQAINAALRGAMNAPGLAVALLLGIVGLAVGYYLGSHHYSLPMSGGTASRTPSASQDAISVHFSPKGGCTETCVDEISNAHQTIEVQAYSFTSRDIVNALIAAQHRGVKVTVICDQKALGEQGSKGGQAAQAGITVMVDGQHPIAHNKIILIDGRTIVTGSFNFTQQAENGNAENLLVLHDKADLYRAYDANFHEHLAHSVPYNPSLVKADKRSERE